jgi:hypothetical protein
MAALATETPRRYATDPNDAQRELIRPLEAMAPFEPRSQRNSVRECSACSVRVR